MSVEELYAALNIPARQVLERFGGNAALLERFLKKFPADPNYARLQKAVETKNGGEMEVTAHTLKGVSANFGFDALSSACAEIVAAVRAKDLAPVPAAFEKLKTEYGHIVEMIDKM